MTASSDRCYGVQPSICEELAPADDYMTWQRDKGVKLYIEKSGPGSEKPFCVMTALQRTVDKSPNHPALAYKAGEKWCTYSYKEYLDLIKQTARSFIKLGLEPFHGVGIIGFNSPEWFISDLAAIFAGGFAVGIYTTNSPDACYYVAQSAECNIIVVENHQQLQKILEIRKRLPHLKAIVQYVGSLKESYPNVYSWSDMLQLCSVDQNIFEEKLTSRIKAQNPNRCCTLIYTSGTTGNPKGVMVSHDNLTWTAASISRLVSLEFNKEYFVSYLPLSHVAGQLLDIYGPIISGATVYFAQPDALRGSLVTTLKDARPTVFLGVPRVWEKMQEAMVNVGRSNGYVKQMIASWAKDVGLRGNMAIMNGGSVPFGFTLAHLLVFKKVRFALGLDRCRLCLTGAAPIMRETLQYFMSLNIPLFEVYGMSESSGPHTLSYDDNFMIGSVGREFPGATTLLANPDAEGNGEICMHGRHVFMGYLNMKDKTQEALDGRGWLHSGDIGRKDKNGFLFITGRLKELIITAGGENIPPVLIEDTVKECLPCVSNCMLVGDKRKFLTMLLTLKTTVDMNTMIPTEKLSETCLYWCRALGSNSTTVTEIVKGPDKLVMKAIQLGIDTANNKATSRAQFIQRWAILPVDFSVPGGELGPTLKLKRSVVAEKYASTIDKFYAGSD